MPISREQKADLIESYKDAIANSHAIVLTDNRGLSVKQLQRLRSMLRENDASYIIAKKTLMVRALAELDRPSPRSAMIGSTGFAFLGEDLAAGAKALKDFAKEAGELFIVTGGLLGDSVLDASGAAALADLPSRDVQLAQLVAAIAAPMSSLVSVLTAPHRDLVGLLQARIDKEGGEAAEAA
ncbi:MAG: 50S ribosomal protein L10 [Caldilineales bacterium]|nr:50S ribosomal protein L10 [Caldilineales bacterium]